MSKPLCQYNPPKAMVLSSLNRILAEGGSEAEMDAKILKISQDYVREVVAHEVGHTLGMRHNFAGSLAANFEAKDLPGIFKDYLRSGHVADSVVPTSSVMEYEGFEESTFSGDLMSRGMPAFDYDSKAMKVLYERASFNNNEIPLFCTDSHAGVMLDCNTFDSGSSIFANAKAMEAKALANLPYQLLAGYLSAMLDTPGAPLHFSSFSPTDLAETILALRAPVMSALKEDTPFLKIRRSFDSIDEFNLIDVKTQEADYVASELKKFGGLASFFTVDDPRYLEPVRAQFANLIERSNFTVEEKKLITADADKFFARFSEALFSAEFALLSEVTGVAQSEMGSELAKVVAAKASAAILSTKGSVREELVAADGSKTTVDVPVFSFPLAVRLQAIKWLTEPSEDVLWGVKEKNRIIAQLKDLLQKALGTDVGSVSVDDQADTLARWILENKKVLTTLIYAS